MYLSPDKIIFWQSGAIALNATLLFTWGLMALLGISSWTNHAPTIDRYSSVSLAKCFGSCHRRIAGSNTRYQRMPTEYLLAIYWYFVYFHRRFQSLRNHPRLSSAHGLSFYNGSTCYLCFLAVPFYGIRQSGLKKYLKHYLQPHPLMLPFHLIGELSRTLSFAIRLFGNVMSDVMIVAILLSIALSLFPIIMQVLELLTGLIQAYILLTGLIQAYIFAILAMVYIASATEAQQVVNNSHTGEKEQRNHE
jgi:F-type H+-transporting ATPase subunit a